MILAVSSFLPSCFFMVIKVGVILNNTASSMEHKNEKNMDNEAYNNSNDISS